MFYPLNLILSRENVFPLFGNQLRGEPFIFDFSSNNPRTFEMETTNFENFQSMIFTEMSDYNCEWGIGRYLEERRGILRNYPQIVDEGRVYHLGLDIIAPKGFILYAPIAGEVFMVGIEEGIGNYGGYVILKHEIFGSIFYTFYGHLDRNHRISKGQKIAGGQELGVLGDKEDSGGWFTHTHLQIITEKARDKGFLFHGYISADNFAFLDEYFPSPYFLFRV